MITAAARQAGRELHAGAAGAVDHDALRAVRPAEVQQAAHDEAAAADEDQRKRPVDRQRRHRDAPAAATPAVTAASSTTEHVTPRQHRKDRLRAEKANHGAIQAHAHEDRDAGQQRGGVDPFGAGDRGGERCRGAASAPTTAPAECRRRPPTSMSSASAIAADAQVRLRTVRSISAWIPSPGAPFEDFSALGRNAVPGSAFPFSSPYCCHS